MFSREFSYENFESMNRQFRSTRSFASQHVLEISKIPKLSAEDFATYKLDGLLPPRLSGLNLLDVGCGTCRVTRHLASLQPKSIHCIDPAITPDQFRALTEDFNNDLSLTKFSFTQTIASEFHSEGCFDLISLLGVLHHIPNPNETLRHLSQFLADDGRIVLWLYSKDIGVINMFSLKILRFIFRFLGPLKIKFTYLIYGALRQAHHFRNSSVIDEIMNKTREEAILVLFDQLNAGYAKYYSEKDILKIAELNSLHIVKILRTGNKGWTVLMSKQIS
jgi:2-polyprenyl-3-methyl-5-hydroxy-6-metoxy-1,4-benzoquinol methylase